MDISLFMTKKIKLISIIFISFIQIIYANNNEYREKYENILDEKTYVLYKNKNITITFNKNRISGKITVNKYNASFSINDQNVEVNNISKTKMIGQKELMNIENEYLDLLSNAETIKIRGNFLTIKTKDNKELIFKEKVDLSVNYLNGKEFTRTWLSYDELMQGGVIEYQMGNQPNMTRGIAPADKPYSYTSIHQ